MKSQNNPENHAPVITITSDMGYRDYYLGALKGAILRRLPRANIVDISHSIRPYDIQEGAFVIRNSYFEFPKGSVHIIGINPELGNKTTHVAVEYDGQYFVGADNGIFSLIFDKKPTKIIEIENTDSQLLQTFPLKDVFVPAACQLANGGEIEKLGKAKQQLLERILFMPTIENSSVIKGIVIYIDTHSNVICNITRQIFDEFGKGRKFVICFKHADYNINTISKNYNDVPEGERLAFFNSTGNLEIAINKGTASSLLGMKSADIIRIEFSDRKNS